MVQIIITPYIHLQYFDLFFSQQTWLNPVLLLFCRWKCLEKIMGMLASLTFNAYPLTSNGPFLATLQHFLTDNHFTSYSLQAHGPSSSIFMFSWWPTFSFTKKTEEIKNDCHHFSPYIYPPTYICFLLSSLLWQLKCLNSLLSPPVPSVGYVPSSLPYSKTSFQHFSFSVVSTFHSLEQHSCKHTNLL